MRLRSNSLFEGFSPHVPKGKAKQRTFDPNGDVLTRHSAHALPGGNPGDFRFETIS